MQRVRIFAVASVLIAAATGAAACSSHPAPAQPVADLTLTSAIDSIVEAGRSELASPRGIDRDSPRTHAARG